MSLLEALGNVVDLPGSSVRDLLRGQNPLDQYLSPFSQENRTSGQDLLHALGVQGDSPWLSMGTEMALDPMTYLGLGMAGKGAKALGITGKAKSAASNVKQAVATAGSTADLLSSLPGMAKGAAKKVGSLLDVFRAHPQDIWPESMKAINPRRRPVDLLADALSKTVYDPNARQLIGGAGGLYAAMAGRETNHTYP